MKTTQLTIVASSLSLCFFSGCRTFTSPAKQAEVNAQVSRIEYDISRRGTYIIKTGTEEVQVAPGAGGATTTKTIFPKYITISEPAPDAGVAAVVEFIAKVKMPEKVDVEGTAKVTESMTEFGKRTQMIMFLRESLFRLTEIGHNADYTKAEYTAAYDKVMQAALDVLKIEKDEAERKKLEAEDALFKTKLRLGVVGDVHAPRNAEGVVPRIAESAAPRGFEETADAGGAAASRRGHYVSHRDGTYSLTVRGTTEHFASREALDVAREHYRQQGIEIREQDPSARDR